MNTTAKAAPRDAARFVGPFGRLTLAAFLICLVFVVAPSAASAFGISNFSYTNSTLQAGGHPDVTIAFQRTGGESEDLKDIQLDLPTGVFANPESANPKCTASQFAADNCPATAQVGVAQTTVKALGLLDLTINGSVDVLTADPNQTATMGITLRPDPICILFVFCAVPQKIFLKTGVTVRTYEDSGLRTYTPGSPRSAVIGIPLLFNAQITGDITVNKLSLSFQSRSGTPTTKRVCGGFLNLSCSDVPVPASGPYFWRQAGSCTPISSSITLVSYQNATASATQSYTPTGCNNVGWNPQFTFRPDTNKGGASTPVTFTLNLPEADQAIQDSLPKIVDMDMPNGSGLDLGALGGVTSCTEDQLKAEACPASSIIGTANAFSKYLPSPTNPSTTPGLVGNVYAMGVGNQIPIAVQIVGPGHTTVIFRGTMGTRGDANAGTGRVYATFDRIPQLPFRQFTLKITKTVFKNPPVCGTATSTADLTAFNGTPATSGNGTKVTRTDSYTLVNCDPEPQTTITDGPPSTTPVNTPTFRFTSNIPTALFQCRLDGDGVFTPCTSPYTTQALADGPHYLEVRAVNGATTDATPARADFTVDTTGISITPHITVSTTAAVQHPDVSASFDVDGGQPKQIALRMPAGFVASLSAVPLCASADAQAGTCSTSSKIGTAQVTAEIFGGTTETGVGDIFLTDGPTAADAAGVSAVVHFSFGDLIAQGGAYLVENGKYQYIDLREVPNTVGTTQFNVKNLTTNFSGANNFLTNPSACTATAWQSSGTDYAGTTAEVFTVPFQATACGSVPFHPTINQQLTNPVAGQTTGVNATVTLQPGDSSIKSLRVNEPPSLGPNFPSFGQQTDQCPASAAPTASSVFDATLCPPQSVVGSMTINTPLLTEPLTGTVYLINKSPLPWLGVKFDKPGIAVRLTGVTSTPQVDPSCDPLLDPNGFCQTQISVLFNNVPDVPVSSISLALDGPNRTGNGGVQLSGRILTVATPSDPTCLPTSPARAVFAPYSGNPTFTVDQPIAIQGCPTP